MEINNNSNFAGQNFNGQYNILHNFFDSRPSKNYSLYQTLALDLYRSINFFRLYNNVEHFLTDKPEFEEYRDDIEELWDEFSQMTQKELAEVSLRILTDL